MSSNKNGVSPAESPPSLPASAPSPQPAKTRPDVSRSVDMTRSHSESSSISNRRSRPPAAALFASTQTPPGSRPTTPPVSRGPLLGSVAGSVFDKGASRAPTSGGGDNPGDPLNLILKAFVPHVAVLASNDTEDICRAKGFRGGLWELLRPFGERIHGKVTVRDSNGASRSYDDFAIRFIRFGENIEAPDPSPGSLRASEGPNGTTVQLSKSRKKAQEIEDVVGRHLAFAEDSPKSPLRIPCEDGQDHIPLETSPYYSLYLRRLLSGLPLTPHETFGQAVACVIAISSRSKAPIDELRRLYGETSQGDRQLPIWVDGDYLRYYVLVHDEETDNIARSMALFEQMKRNLGLHCHLLRLRSSQSAESDDDSIPLPRSEWMTASEELKDLENSEEEEVLGDISKFIFESDATAIRTFVREMVAQSIVPTMERHISIWNEQVASRRRGIAGRFMSLSRKWTGFGNSSRSSSSAGGGVSSNYDVLGFYRPDTPEAIMRKLADYAFMLRDWKLAHSTYDIVRADFYDAKAWKYHAAANEMAALSLLLFPQSLPSKTRSESVDQMLEAAVYSYSTRCDSPFGTLRSLVLAFELLILKGGSSIDDAARWGVRLLEAKILGPVGNALLRERISHCYASKEGVGSQSWGSRKRKAALWSTLAAENWYEQQIYLESQRCLNDAQAIYYRESEKGQISKFEIADDFLRSLNRKLAVQHADWPGDIQATNALIVDEESEALDIPSRTRRGSTLGSTATTGLESAPLRDVVVSEVSREGSIPDGFG